MRGILFNALQGDRLAMKSLLPHRHLSSVLGIDVQSCAIHLVEVSTQAPGVPRLQNCAWAPCEPGWVIQGHIVAFEEVSQRLRELVQRTSWNTRCGVLGMPSRSVTTYRLTVPVCAGQDEVARAVEASVASRLGGRPEDWVVDYCDSDAAATQVDSPAREVMVALSRRDRIHDRLGLAESAGVQVLAIDLETQACEVAWATLHGATASESSLTRAVLLHLDDDGVQAMARVNGLVCAESALCWRDLPAGPLVTPTLEARVHGLAQWLRTAHQWTRPQSEQPLTELPQWDIVYLTGSVSHHEPWATSLGAVLGVPVQILNPLDAIDDRQTAGLISHPGAGSEYFKAYGLALQGALQ